MLLYLIFGIIRPIVREVINRRYRRKNIRTARPSKVARAKAKKAKEVVDEVEMQRREYAANLEAAREIIRNDPRMAAQIIKEWISDE